MGSIAGPVRLMFVSVPAWFLFVLFPVRVKRLPLCPYRQLLVLVLQHSICSHRSVSEYSYHDVGCQGESRIPVISRTAGVCSTVDEELGHFNEVGDQGPRRIVYSESCHDQCCASLVIGRVHV